MASIRERNGRYQVQIRRTGQPTVTKSFLSKKEAERWARSTEVQVEAGTYQSVDLNGLTVGDLLTRYLSSVTPLKRSEETESRRIDRLLRDPVASIQLDQISSMDIAAFRDRRVLDGTRTCQYDLAILRHMFRLAIEEWSLPLPSNPVDRVRKPKSNPPRERRLEKDEYERLRGAASKTRTPWLWPLIDLAIETAMRRGELLGLLWPNIKIDERLALLEQTKNGTSRLVPLSPSAIHILTDLPQDQDRVFNVTGNAVRMAWERLTEKAEIEDLHFHDLRHEAISRLFERGLSVPEVALISGHKTPSQLFRYTNLRAQWPAPTLSTTS